MRQRTRLDRFKKFLKAHKWASIAVAAGVLLIAAAFIPWGGSDSDKTASDLPTSQPTIDNGLFDPNDTGGLTGNASGDSETVKADKNPFAKGGSKSDPFATATDDNTLHTVTVSATSNGAMNIGFRFRGGNGDGVKVAKQTFTYTHKVRGGLPVGQIGVQVLANGSYATCSVSVDGVEVSSGKTTKGPGYVVVCTG